ncbi:unnamed protein product [Macrosiphum euphorbiae]|uniref:Reverse transcriptase domain-containing protein n=1 Tax=Macrosiphum euphorbiae TaxID=13131 RepID=A0AAV0VRB7_9HEMI|nr:unnamed protein product [Macrosiphum euphorbiae]
MDELRILQWNCNGITNKTYELAEFTRKNKIDIILLGETRLNKTAPLKLPNYYTYRTDRPPKPECPSSGGTAILVKNNIIHEEIFIKTKLDSTTIAMAIGAKTVRVSAVYKSPGDKIEIKDIDALTNGTESFIIAGDLNAKHPSWHSRRTNQTGKILLDHMERNGQYTICAPDSPTHFPFIPHHNPDVLDITLTNLQQDMTISNFNDLSSDHNPILITINKSPKTNTPPLANRRINWKKFKAEMTMHPIKHQAITNPKEIEDNIGKLTKSIQKALSNNSSLLNQPNRTPISPEILLEIETKRILRKRWQQTHDPTYKKMYNAQINYVKKLLQTHRQEEWDTFTQTLNFEDKSIYKLNRRLLRKKPACAPLKTTSGIRIFDEKLKAELFADTMSTQFSNNPGPPNKEVEHSIQIINDDQTPNNDYITPNEVLDIIKKLPKAKAPGMDQITNTTLKNLPSSSIITLARIYTACLRYSYFPKYWKTAAVIMIPKPGKPHSAPENYRPISLLNTMSKILEKLILFRLKKYIEPRPEQHAFRTGHSTTLQLTKLIDDLSVSQGRKQRTAALFLDMEKAFDRVWHNGLIHKLLGTRTPINLVKLIKSFLTNRQFFIKISHHQSTTRQIEAGVPQGSCLSPLLYTVFINDLPSEPQVSTSLFADDTMFHTSNKNATYAILRLQRQINITTRWLTQWRLRLNVSKTVAILFGTKATTKLKKITIHNTEINWSSDAKYLGVTLNKSLSLHNHVEDIINKAKRSRAALYPLLNSKSHIPINARLSLFKIYIRPILLYAAPAWGPKISRSNWKKIEAVQNVGLRSITAIPPYQSNKSLLAITKIPSIEEDARKATTIMFNKNTRSLYPHIQKLGVPDPEDPICKSRPFYFKK